MVIAVNSDLAAAKLDDLMNAWKTKFTDGEDNGTIYNLREAQSIVKPGGLLDI